MISIDKFKMTVVSQEFLDNLSEKVSKIEELIKEKTKEEANSQWLDSNEVQSILGISSKTWQNYRNNKVIPFTQFGRKILVNRKDLEDFMKSNYIGKK